MQKILFILICFCTILCSCAKDVEIGMPVPIEPDYVLPQGNASKAVNDTIQQWFDRYGSYFLYEYTDKDANWAQVAGSASVANLYTVVKGDPVYAEDMLKFLNEIWLKHLPENFKKGSGLPYRIFLADVIRRGPFLDGRPNPWLYLDAQVTGKSIAFAGLSDTLYKMTPAQKLARKNSLIGTIFKYYTDNSIVVYPNEFYSVSDYGLQPTTPVNATNPANLEAYRQRGFLPSGYNVVSGASTEWLSNAYSWTNAKTNDLNSFVLHLFQRTDEQMKPYLDNYPLIKKKFDLLVNHFRNKYGIDVRGIANATF